MSLRRPNGFISAGYDPLKTPDAPTIGTATATGPTSVSVTFTAPSNVGGSAITGYVATAKKTSDGTTISGTGSSSPVTISGLTLGDAYTVTVAAVNSFGLGVSSAASNSVTPAQQRQLWSWGDNGSGQLALGDTIDRSSPVQVGALTTWEKASVGADFCAAIRVDGTLWTWGSGASGVLGSGSTQSVSSPVQVGGLSDWSIVASGSAANCGAIKSNGTLWLWGSSSNGALGNNTSGGNNQSSPVQIGSLTIWSKLSVGTYSCIAVRTDGRMFSWGSNNYGQLGINSSDAYGGQDRSSPVQIGSLTNWSQVTTKGRSSAAVKTDGTLWSWGLNGYGQLGLGDVINRSSPVQIGALTNWSTVAMGSYHCCAIKTDGTLWAWGLNGSGRLGLNNTINRSSPVQVGALTNWVSVESATANCAATQSNGTLWTWGEGFKGKLGQNSTVNFSSPVQIGSLTTWAAAHVGGSSTFAIKG
jgi:alpha-tubulin suppressor-like RCC1 family protein